MNPEIAMGMAMFGVMALFGILVLVAGIASDDSDPE